MLCRRKGELVRSVFGGSGSLPGRLTKLSRLVKMEGLLDLLCMPRSDGRRLHGYIAQRDCCAGVRSHPWLEGRASRGDVAAGMIAAHVNEVETTFLRPGGDGLLPTGDSLSAQSLAGRRGPPCIGDLQKGASLRQSSRNSGTHVTLDSTDMYRSTRERQTMGPGAST